MPQALRPLVDALAMSSEREAAARHLARCVGASHLLLYVQDPELKVMLPAPGMRKTIAGSQCWQEFLRRCNAESQVHGEVEVFGRRWNAFARVERGCAFVLLGEHPGCFPTELVEALPILAEVLRAQQALSIGMAEAALAREAAERAHQLARALDQARAAAAELNLQLRIEHQHKDDFLAMLSHELRNPLAPVITGVEILRRLSPENVAARDRQLAIINRQLQQLTHLVDDLLDVSRVSRGKVELRREVLQLDGVIAAAVESTKPFIVSRRHDLVLTCAGGDMHVDGDRVRLVQVFSNLLNNAAKYTDPGGKIEVDVTRADRLACVTIRDTGAGIPADMLESVFELFKQVPGSLDRAPGGLGIGLTLVRTLVELHGGQVKALSDGPGRGSEFTVTLPLVSSESVAPRGKHHAPRSSAAGRVLIVDDNVDAADSLAEVLRMMGASVTVVNDGAQALAAGAADPPELVLLDIGLPGMDGYETAREWRRRFGPASRLIALTGYGGAEDRRRTASSGFDGHLVKPVTVDVISSLLEETQRDQLNKRPGSHA